MGAASSDSDERSAAARRVPVEHLGAQAGWVRLVAASLRLSGPPHLRIGPPFQTAGAEIIKKTLQRLGGRIGAAAMGRTSASDITRRASSAPNRAWPRTPMSTAPDFTSTAHTRPLPTSGSSLGLRIARSGAWTIRASRYRGRSLGTRNCSINSPPSSSQTAPTTRSSVVRSRLRG
jgi:hypothetical protein